MTDATMKAIMNYGEPGADFRYEDVPMPKAGPGEIVLKVMSATTCGTDVKAWKRGYKGTKAGETTHGVGKIFGHEAAGVVYEVGEGVTNFKVGDRVTTHNSAPCGHCYWCKRGQFSLCEHLTFAPGAWAEYRRIPAPIVQQNAFIIPDGLSYAMAAIVEPLSCAVYNIVDSGLEIGDIVVVNGAGPLGLMQIRAAKLRGARVIACDSIPFRLECAKALGADEVINITEIDDQVKAVVDLTPDKRGVDIAIDCTGIPAVWEMNLAMVRKGGTVMEFGGCKPGATVTFDCHKIHYGQITIKGLFHTTPRVVQQSFDMLARGLFPEEIFIGKSFPLEKAQAALESHARGEVVKNEIVCDLG